MFIQLWIVISQSVVVFLSMAILYSRKWQIRLTEKYGTSIENMLVLCFVIDFKFNVDVSIQV